jgi:hypothetical protein
LLMHGVYLGGVFVAIRLGLEAGLTALIVSLQPLLVASAAPLFLAERVEAGRWLGLGLGFVGVMLVLAGKLGYGGSVWAIVACVAALAGITAGTLYQKRWCAGQDLRTGNLIQFSAAAGDCWLVALLLETRRIDWTPELVLALVWLVVVLSLGAIPLLYLLLRRLARVEPVLPHPAHDGTDRLAPVRRVFGFRGDDPHGADRGRRRPGQPGSQMMQHSLWFRISPSSRGKPNADLVAITCSVANQRGGGVPSCPAFAAAPIAGREPVWASGHSKGGRRPSACICCQRTVATRAISLTHKE